MRVKLVKDSLFPKSPMWSVEITDDTADTIRRAVFTDHPCEESQCDVVHAANNGYPLAAAYLMFGATECPALSATFAALEFNGATDLNTFTAFDEWCDSTDSNSVECPDCGLHLFGIDPGDDVCCHNCLHQFEAPHDCPWNRLDSVMGAPFCGVCDDKSD